MSEFNSHQSQLDEASLAPAERLCEWVRNGEIENLRNHLDETLTAETFDRDGNSLLMLASRHGQVEICELLLRLGAEVNAANPQGNTSLIYAAMFNRKDVVDLLLKNDANAYAKSTDGLTALGIARAMGAEAAASRLAQHVELF